MLQDTRCGLERHYYDSIFTSKGLGYLYHMYVGILQYEYVCVFLCCEGTWYYAIGGVAIGIDAQL